MGLGLGLGIGLGLGLGLGLGIGLGCSYMSRYASKPASIRAWNASSASPRRRKNGLGTG